MLIDRPRLCIATLDPLNRGGILALMKFVYEESGRDGFDPYLAYNRVPGIRGERNARSRGVSEESLEGMDGMAAERVLPHFEFFNYLLNRKEWRMILREGDVFFGVCGNNLAALPFVFARKRFSLWVASTLYEERIDRMRQQSFLRQVRDFLSLPILLRFEKKVFVHAEHILALSAYTRDEIVRKYPFTAGKISVAPYPVDAEFFYPVPSAVAGQQQASYLFFAGRLEDARKNISLALRALALARASRPDLRLKLSGGKLGPRAAALVRSLKLEDAVDVLPLVSREELRTLHQNASLFIIPSFQEGLCISGLEAMACGIPVVSTRCGGPEEFVQDGKNGRLVPNDDERAFAAAVSELLQLSSEGRKQMAAAARATVLNRYVRDKVWPRFQECLTIKK